MTRTRTLLAHAAAASLMLPLLALQAPALADSADSSAGSSVTSEPTPSPEPTPTPSPDPDPPEPKPQPRFGMPKVGTCYDVGRGAADKDALKARTIPCRRAHTLQVVRTFVAPARMSLDSDALWKLARKRCWPAVTRVVGASSKKYVMSTRITWTHLPTKAQQKRGAHWVSCSTGSYNGSKTLVRGKGNIAKLPKGPLSKKNTFCGDRNYNFVSCAKPHAHRQAWMTMVKGYPRSSDMVWNRLAKICPGKIGRENWSMSAWRAGGPRYGIFCMTKK